MKIVRLVAGAACAASLVLAGATAEAQPAPKQDEKKPAAGKADKEPPLQRPAPLPTRPKLPSPRQRRRRNPLDRQAATRDMARAGGAGSVRGKAHDWMITPAGMSSLGGTFRFMTAPDGIGTGPLRFTDVVFADVHYRRSIKGRAEVFGSATFLPKQPSFLDEFPVQSGSLGAQVGFGKRYAAYLVVDGGDLVGPAGFSIGSALGLSARKSLHEVVRLEGGVGGAATTLFFTDDDRDFWFTEATTYGQIVFRAPRNEAALWIGTEFRFPIVAEGDEDGRPPYDPQTRVNFELGGALGFIENWDIFVKYVITDRGDIADPLTTLPILETGFDQRFWVFGLNRRFYNKKPRKRDRPMILL